MVTSIDINDDAIELLGPAIDKKRGETILSENWFNLSDAVKHKADIIAGDGIHH